MSLFSVRCFLRYDIYQAVAFLEFKIIFYQYMTARYI